MYDEACITFGGRSIRYHATEGKHTDCWELVEEDALKAHAKEDLRLMCIDRAINAINHGIGNRNLIELAKQLVDLTDSELKQLQDVTNDSFKDKSVSIIISEKSTPKTVIFCDCHFKDCPHNDLKGKCKILTENCLDL